MQIRNWDINTEVQAEADKHYRTRFALSLKDKEVLEIVKGITFDKAAPKISLSDIEELFRYVNNRFLGGKIKGVGLEVGAGCGVFSSILARHCRVKKMYAVEFIASIVKELMSKVVTKILGDKSNKVIGCVGDFNNLELDNESVDFVFDFFSLHHSDNLKKTLQEANRVLKPGGFILCFDKARPNRLSEEDLESMLDKEYDDKFKESFGIPTELKLTRRMNGEHEYRLKDWQATFSATGFYGFEYYYLKKTLHSGFLMRLVKNIVALLPNSIQVVITKLLNKETEARFTFEPQNIIYTSKINPFPKEISLMIAWKK